MSLDRLVIRTDSRSVSRPVMVLFLLLLLLSLLSLIGCHTTANVFDSDKPADVIAHNELADDDPDSHLTHMKRDFRRIIAAQTDERESHDHGSFHDFHPGTVHGSKVIDTNQKEAFRKSLSTFKEPKAISDNYEYQTNREDVIARHTFVLAGTDRRLGQHVALFESRHQHQAIVKLDFDFTGAGLKKGVVSTADLKAGKALFESRILKEGQPGVPALKKGEAYAVQVSPLNPEFELVTIPTGITRTFLGSLAVIDESTKVTRFNKKGADVIVKITDVHHFSRLYVKESPRELQYMAFSANAAGNRTRYILAHVIQGSIPGPGVDDSLNMEQLVEVEIEEPVDFAIKDGSILKFPSRAVDALLAPNEQAEAKFVRDGGSEDTDFRALPDVKMRVQRVIYKRPLGIDPSQDSVRKRVRGE